MSNPNYFSNCQAIDRNESSALNAFLKMNNKVTHEEQHICGYCQDEMATGEDQACDACRRSLREIN